MGRCHGRDAQHSLVVLNQLAVFVGLATVEVDDGLEVAQLPLGPLVEGAVHGGVVVAGINKEHLVTVLGTLATVKEPQRARQRQGIEEVVSHAHHHINVTGAHELLADVTLPLAAVGGGTGHDKACPAMVIEISIEITNPKVIGIAHLLLLVIDAWQAKRQTPGTHCRLGLDLIDIEGRIGHHIVALACQVVGIVIESVGFVARDDAAIEPMHRHVHQAQLGVVFHLFLTIEGHLGIGVHARLVHEVARLHKHSATAASGI